MRPQAQGKDVGALGQRDRERVVRVDVNCGHRLPDTSPSPHAYAPGRLSAAASTMRDGSGFCWVLRRPWRPRERPNHARASTELCVQCRITSGQEVVKQRGLNSVLPHRRARRRLRLALRRHNIGPPVPRVAARRRLAYQGPGGAAVVVPVLAACVTASRGARANGSRKDTCLGSRPRPRARVAQRRCANAGGRSFSGWRIGAVGPYRELVRNGAPCPGALPLRNMRAGCRPRWRRRGSRRNRVQERSAPRCLRAPPL
jgi:hypothetical protein